MVRVGGISMSPLSSCGQFMSDRYSREKCLPCNGKGCKCCQNKGRHYMPGTQENLGAGRVGLARIINGSVNAHKDKKRSAA